MCCIRFPSVASNTSVMVKTDAFSPTQAKFPLLFPQHKDQIQPNSNDTDSWLCTTKEMSQILEEQAKRIHNLRERQDISEPHWISVKIYIT